MPGICRIPPEERWERCRELLLLADPDPLMVERYLPACEMLALCEGEKVLSEVCVEQPEAGDWELRNAATRPELEGRGYASALIREVQQCQAREAGRSLVVGTSPGGRSRASTADWDLCPAGCVGDFSCSTRNRCWKTEPYWKICRQFLRLELPVFIL